MGVVLHKLLADAWRAALFATIAGSTSNARIENTFHLPPLAFPTAVGAFADLSPLHVREDVM